ncbi:hypothetical protein FGO68_gene954 [Halteria grandinella]|uniref:Uncharacterized protein n=1 Tax=Halteria grandinella TaxID=5974 RepID=A0A8J8T4H4_HALGN|nr:hypothetical protein FGO68_gene954 [Halteria grandinella]
MEICKSTSPPKDSILLLFLGKIRNKYIVVEILSYAYCRAIGPVYMHQASTIFRKMVIENPQVIMKICAERADFGEYIDSTLEECLWLHYTNFSLAKMTVNLNKQEDLRLLAAFKNFGDKRLLLIDYIKTECIDFANSDVQQCLSVLKPTRISLTAVAEAGRYLISNLHIIPTQFVKLLFVHPQNITPDFVISNEGISQENKAYIDNLFVYLLPFTQLKALLSAVQPKKCFVITMNYNRDQSLEIINSLLDEATVINNPDITILFNSKEYDEEFLQLFKDKLKTEKKYLAGVNVDTKRNIWEKNIDLFKKHCTPRPLMSKINQYIMLSQIVSLLELVPDCLSIPSAIRLFDCQQYSSSIKSRFAKRAEEINRLSKDSSTKNIRFYGHDVRFAALCIQYLFENCSNIDKIDFKMYQIGDFQAELEPDIDFTSLDTFTVTQDACNGSQLLLYSTLLSRFKEHFKVLEIDVTQNNLEVTKTLLSSVACKEKITELDLKVSSIDQALIELLSLFKGVKEFRIGFTADICFNEQTDQLRFLLPMASTLEIVELAFFDEAASSADYVCKFLSKSCFKKVRFIDLTPLKMTFDQMESIISTKNNKKLLNFKQFGQNYSVEFAKRIQNLYPYAKLFGNIGLDNEIPYENQEEELLRILKADQLLKDSARLMQVKDQNIPQ